MFLIVGADSAVGSAVFDALRNDGHDVIGTTRRKESAGPGRTLLDLSNVPTGWEPPAGTRAVCIAAAVARLVDCEADPVGSAQVNCAGAIELATRLAGRGIYTLFLSTNQVFDGSTPHVPADAAQTPASEYGRQKARTEIALQRLMADGAPIGVLRLSKVVPPDLALFVGWRNELREGKTVRAFRDMALAPVPLALVVQAIVSMLRDRIALVVQLTGPRDVTYLSAARYIAGMVGADIGLVESGLAAEIGLPPGATPEHTTLESGFLSDMYRIVVPDADEVVASVIGRLK